MKKYEFFEKIGIGLILIGIGIFFIGLIGLILNGNLDVKCQKYCYNSNYTNYQLNQYKGFFPYKENTHCFCKDIIDIDNKIIKKIW